MHQQLPGFLASLRHYPSGGGIHCKPRSLPPLPPCPPAVPEPGCSINQAAAGMLACNADQHPKVLKVMEVSGFLLTGSLPTTQMRLAKNSLKTRQAIWLQIQQHYGPQIKKRQTASSSPPAQQSSWRMLLPSSVLRSGINPGLIPVKKKVPTEGHNCQRHSIMGNLP